MPAYARSGMADCGGCKGDSTAFTKAREPPPLAAFLVAFAKSVDALAYTPLSCCNQQARSICMAMTFIASTRQGLYLYRLWLRREIHGRYRGSMLGVAWTLIQPVLQLMLFTLVFHEFMGIRWPIDGMSGTATGVGYYIVQVFVGLAVFNFTAEVLNRSPQAILSHANLVTKVRFPVVLLPVVTVGAAAVQAVLSLILVMLTAPFWGKVTLAWVAVPAIVAILAVYVVGLAWCLAALGVYVRDTAQIIPLVSSALLFISPVFYPGSFFPPSWDWLLWANPVAWAMEAVRSTLMLGRLSDISLLFWHGVSALGFAAVGYLWFQRLREGFADVL